MVWKKGDSVLLLKFFQDGIVRIEEYEVVSHKYRSLGTIHNSIPKKLKSKKPRKKTRKKTPEGAMPFKPKTAVEPDMGRVVVNVSRRSNRCTEIGGLETKKKWFYESDLNVPVKKPEYMLMWTLPKLSVEMLQKVCAGELEDFCERRERSNEMVQGEYFRYGKGEFDSDGKSKGMGEKVQKSPARKRT